MYVWVGGWRVGVGVGNVCVVGVTCVVVFLCVCGVCFVVVVVFGGVLPA